jgi:hypothetical protein
MPATLTGELGRKSSEVAVSATLSRYRLYSHAAPLGTPARVSRCLTNEVV